MRSKKKPILKSFYMKTFRIKTHRASLTYSEPHFFILNRAERKEIVQWTILARSQMARGQKWKTIKGTLSELLCLHYNRRNPQGFYVLVMFRIMENKIIPLLFERIRDSLYNHWRTKNPSSEKRIICLH